MPIASGRIGTVWTTGHHRQDPSVTLILVPEDSAAVPVNWPKSEPKVHLPLTTAFAGRRPQRGARVRLAPSA
jgi:hypothetical protein